MEVKQFIYDGTSLLRETDESWTLEAEYTYQPQPYGNKISQSREDESSFYLIDGIHNVTELTDDTVGSKNRTDGQSAGVGCGENSRR